MKRPITLLAGLAILFLMPVLSSGRITRNGKADEIREEVEKITRSRKSNAEVRKKKRQKLSTKPVSENSSIFPTVLPLPTI